MYNSAEDKKKFLEHISNFVLSMINNKVVAESILNILEPNLVSIKNTTKYTSKKNSIKVTENKNG